MATATLSAAAPPNLQGIHRQRLFFASCCALAVSAVAFAVVGDILGTLKEQFVLSNLEVGYIAGAAVWGFSMSILLLGPLCDVLGMSFLLRCAMVCHFGGVLLMVFAGGFWQLFAGAWIISLGNGLVEAVCNPLVATLYPEDKAHRLNQFHVWWPGGIVLGGLASYGLAELGVTSWQLRLGLVLVPAVLYSALMLRERFPATENVQSGVSTGEMFRATFTSPLFLLMLALMFITASIELGPNRWIPAVLQAGGIPGILVLVWISGLMAVLRMKASGPLLRRLSPTGILLLSTALTGVGLLLLSYSESGVAAFASATVFALGICFIWPTMLGFVAERVPRSGALGLALMGGAGMGIVGLVTAPVLGKIADQVAHERFVAEQPAVVQVLTEARDQLGSALPTVHADQRGDVENSIALVEGVLASQQRAGQLPAIETANAFRSVLGTGVQIPAAEHAQALLGPAENYGGRISFRYCVPLAAAVVIVFALLYASDRRRGGYRVERIGAAQPAGTSPPEPRVPATAR
jgi:MFS family permease